MDDTIKPLPWEPIQRFSDQFEFARFCDWINENITSGRAVEVDVQIRYRGIESLTEKWFEHLNSQTTWRLVYPDGPFRGLFEQIGA